MISSISWSTYWTVISILLVIYYVSVCSIYYRDEIGYALRGKSNFFSGKESIGQEESEDSLHEISNAPTPFNVEVELTLKHAAEKKLMKQEIIYSLQRLIKKYNIQKSSFDFEAEFNLVSLCSNYCSIHLDEEDVELLWMK